MGNHPSDFNIRKSWIFRLIFGGSNVAKKTTIDAFPIFVSHEQLHLSNIIQLSCWNRGYIQWNPYYSYQIRLSMYIYIYINRSHHIYNCYIRYMISLWLIYPQYISFPHISMVKFPRLRQETPGRTARAFGRQGVKAMRLAGGSPGIILQDLYWTQNILV